MRGKKKIEKKGREGRGREKRMAIKGHLGGLEKVEEENKEWQ